MFYRFRLLFSVAAFAAIFTGSGHAQPVYLNDWCFNNNGNVNVCNGGTQQASAPGSFDTTPSSLDTVANKLGTVSFNLSPGQYAAVYMDYDLSSTFANDYGLVNGVLPGGVSYEITDLNNAANYDNSGNPTIWDDFGITANEFALNDKNGAPTGAFAPNACCDVAWALGFTDTTGQAGTVTFTVSTTNPGGFYLEQLNCGSNSAACASTNPIYLSESFVPSGKPPTGVPEPASALLIIPACTLLLALKRRRRVGGRS